MKQETRFKNFGNISHGCQIFFTAYGLIPDKKWLFFEKVVSILPPRCWRQHISWSYCAASQTFGLVA